AGERIAPHLTDADRVIELRNNDRGDESPAHLRDGEDRILGCDHDIAGCDYPGTAAEATALHQGNRWNGRGIEPLHGLRSRAGDADVLFARGAPHIVEPFQVGTGLKMRSVAAHDDGAKATRACQRIERAKQSVDQCTVVSVIDLRTIENHLRDTALVELPKHSAG